MNRSVMMNLREAAVAKLESSALYREMAILAPDEESHRLLLEMSDEDKACAELFESLYCNVFKQKRIQSKSVYPRLEGPYRNHLVDRLSEERRGYRLYGDRYLNSRDPRFGNAYYRAHTGSNLHTSGLLYLLSLL